jgi:hypothetical protein
MLHACIWKRAEVVGKGRTHLRQVAHGSELVSLLHLCQKLTSFRKQMQRVDVCHLDCTASALQQSAAATTNTLIVKAHMICEHTSPSRYTAAATSDKTVAPCSQHTFVQETVLVQQVEDDHIACYQSTWEDRMREFGYTSLQCANSLLLQEFHS